MLFRSLAVFDAFRDAIRDKSAPRAEALSTHAGWRGRGPAVGRYFRRASRLGHVPEASEEVVVRDDRAAVRFSGADGVAHALFALDEEQQWRLVALPQDSVRSGLHLSGGLSSLARVADLPTSEQGAAWSREVVSSAGEWRPAAWPKDEERVEAVEKLRTLTGEPGVRMDRTGEWELVGLHRVVCGLRFTRRRSDVVDEMWVVLDTPDSGHGLAIHHLAWSDDVDEFVAGFPLDWDGEAVATAEPVAVESVQTDGFTPAQLLKAFDVARAKFLKAGGGSVSDAEAVLDAVRTAYAKRVYRGRGSAERVLPALDVSETLRSYMAEQDPDAEPVIDSAFVANHAAGMLNAMIGAFAKALAPESVSAVARTGKTVTVDVVDLVGGLLPSEDTDDD